MRITTKTTFLVVEIWKLKLNHTSPIANSTFVVSVVTTIEHQINYSLSDRADETSRVPHPIQLIHLWFRARPFPMPTRRNRYSFNGRNIAISADQLHSSPWHKGERSQIPNELMQTEVFRFESRFRNTKYFAFPNICFSILLSAVRACDPS